MAPVVFNLAIIGCAILLGPHLGIDALAVGVVLGSVLHLVIQLPLASRVARYSARIDLRDDATRKAIWLMIPRAIGLGVTQITFLVNTSLATTLGASAIVAYTVAFTILQIPLGVVGFPLGVVLLPSLSHAIAEGRLADFGVLLERSIRLVLWLTIVIAAVGIALVGPTVTILFGDSFPPATLALTADTLAWFLLGVPAHSLNVVLARAFYSAQDTRTPVLVAIGSVVVNVVVSVLTVGSMGLSGLALGIALGGWFESIVLTAILWRRTGALPVRSIGLGGVISCMGALIAAIVALLIDQQLVAMLTGLGPRVRSFVELAVAGSAALAVYLLYSRLMRVPELPQSLRLARSALRRGGERGDVG
jgi:putative peptidoglycan lipid II flippase